MPSLSLKALQSPSASQFNASSYAADARSAAVWSRSNTEDVSFSQLHEFWSGLSIAARRELLRIDKQTLFEQVRKNLYCSRCHGLLVEGFNQILFYGKSLQAGIVGQNNGGGTTGNHVTENAHPDEAVASLLDESRDPSVHPWGGLSATRDSMLTVLDCFLNGKPLEVFDNARVRERERELLYPDACGRGGRGWICQNGSFNGRGHGLKETCVLYTARLSCEALVDFWSALGDETRRSLLRMKEEDFIERLLFRFNSKRFCRDCRRNVLREFKEMKELKRSRKELQCTRWFCAADAVFHYEVSESAVQVDWHDCFAGDGGSAFQRFEWALGTGEGKSDILPFEDVGLSESAYVDNLDLANTSACFITLRGWRRDGRCTELFAKAHALNRQLCVHRRLIVGDGYVSITKGDSIQRFFERAEEIEEEEDEDTIDKDGNDHEGEASRPQKHAKSPELARDFLLDAATVIFKEQVEKAFREGTARQNAHSIFVCLALSLLEERVRVACKEITSLEKQKQLLEEEEYEKREEVERRERRKQKEKEKKLRRKEKLKSKEKANMTNCTSATLDSSGCFTTSSFDNLEEERESNSGSQAEGTESNSSEDSMSARPSSPDMIEARPSADGFDSENGGSIQRETFASAQIVDDAVGRRDGNGAFIVERSKSNRRKTQGRRTLLDTSNRSFRKGFTPLLEADGNSRNIINPHCCEEKGILSSQEQPKNRVHNIEIEAVTKPVDGWSSSPTRNSYNRHEAIQSCACCSSHAGSGSKVGHRVPGRTGIRQSNAGTRPGERAGFGNRSSKSPHLICNDDPALTRKSSEQTQLRSVTATILERKEQRLGSITERAIKTSHLKSSSLNLGSGLSSCHHGRPKSLNDSAGHGSLENGIAVPVVVKPMWTPRAVSASNGVAVKVSSAGSRPLDSEHGKNDGACNGSQVRSVSPCTPAFKSVSPKATNMTTEEFPESAKEEPTFAKPSTVAEGKVFGVLDPNAPIPPRTIMTTDSGQGNFLVTGTDSKVEVSSTITSAPDALSKTVPVQMVLPAVNTGSNALSEDTISTDSRPVAAREGQLSSQARRPVATQGALNFVPEADLSTQVLQSFPSSGTVAGLSPQVYANGQQQVNFLQGNLLRPPSNSMYTHVADILASQGPLQHATQPPNITPLHYPWPFGFFPVDPWAALGRTGVLPIQADGYAVSGPGGLRMGMLPPMSLAAPENVMSGELESGLLSEIPNGLNALQIRDQKPSVTHQVFLSQFGDSPGRGSHGQVMIESIPCLRSDSCRLEGAVATNVGHLHEGQDLLNGSQLPLPGMDERRHTNSPTSADFSFFHSKWPVSRGANETDASKPNTLDSNTNSSSNLPMSGAEKIQLLGGADGVSNSSLLVGEYSLFASAPSKGFGFF